MPFADPNEYMRTGSAIASARSQTVNQTAKTWLDALQPWYDVLNTYMTNQAAMGRQKEGQRYEIKEKIPKEYENLTNLEKLRIELETGTEGYAANVEQTRTETAGMPTAEEARAARAADEAYKGKAGAGIMDAAEEARLRREEMASAERRAQIGAGGKAGAENPSEVIWTFLKENLPVSHADWVKDETGNWSLEGIRADKAKVDQVVSEFEGTYARLYKPEDVKNMADALRTILSTGTPPEANAKADAANLAKVTGMDQGAATLVLKTAYQILNAPFAGMIDMTKLALFTPAREQREAARRWLNTYLPGNLGDRMYPSKTQPTNVAPALPQAPTSRRGGY